MKYIIRALAAIPMLTVGISTIILCVFAIEHPWLWIPAILNLWAFLLIASHYEETVRHLRFFIKDKVEDLYNLI